ncbi:MAG: hypothetical protein WC503_00800 [Candidatus Shapirobacteria bacterium]
MSSPNIQLLKATLENLAKELKSNRPMIYGIDGAWAQGYQGGQWDAGFHIEELLKDFFDYEKPVSETS